MEKSSESGPILHYSQSKDMFWYAVGAGDPIPDGMYYTRSPEGRAAAWNGYYPQGLIVARQMFGGGSFKADRAAAGKLTELKQAEDSLAGKKTVEKYSHLFRMKPYAHQREAIEHMLTFGRLALLLEQGLGKTFISLMALAILKEMGRPHRALIICPNIVFYSWMRETAKATDLSILPYYGTSAVRDKQRQDIREEKPDIVLTTFSSISDRPVPGGYTRPMYLEAISAMSEEGLSAYLGRIRGRLREEEREALGKARTKKQLADFVYALPRRLQPISFLEDVKGRMSSEKFLKELEYDCLIVDEASRCLNHKSKRSQCIEELASRAERVTLLSGTLCVGRPTDLYQPMRILDTNILGMDWTKFKGTFCRMHEWNTKIIAGYKNIDRLKTLVEPYILAKEREKCLDLPPRIFSQRSYTPDENVQSLYNSIVLGETVPVSGYTMHVELTVVKIIKCLQVLSGFVIINDITSEVCSRCPRILECLRLRIMPGKAGCTNVDASGMQQEVIPLGSNRKLEMLAEDLEDCAGEKVIVWAWYRKELADIEAMLKEKKIPYITASEKDCDGRFEADEGCRVFLGQTAQGIGITLNSATTTIYYSHGTALEPRLQSMDRNHRIGQTKSVLVKDYLCAGTIEESIVSLLEHKKEVKDFIQNVSCLACYKREEGEGNCGFSFLQKGCVYCEDRRKAEKKHALKLGGFPDVPCIPGTTFKDKKEHENEV